MRHLFSLSGKEYLARFDISRQFYIGRADVTATAALDTSTDIITLSHAQEIILDGVRYLRRIQILGAHFQASAATNTGSLAPGEFGPSDLLFCQYGHGVSGFRDWRLHIGDCYSHHRAAENNLGGFLGH